MHCIEYIIVYATVCATVGHKFVKLERTCCVVDFQVTIPLSQLERLIACLIYLMRPRSLDNVLCSSIYRIHTLHASQTCEETGNTLTHTIWHRYTNYYNICMYIRHRCVSLSSARRVRLVVNKAERLARFSLFFFDKLS